MDNQNVWLGFQDKLAFPFVRSSSGLPVDWRSEIIALRQLVMKGMAYNTPDPPGPTEMGYPPVTIFRHLQLWRKRAFQRQEPATSLFLVDSSFREYFYSLMNMTAFIINQFRATIGDVDLNSGSGSMSEEDPDTKQAVAPNPSSNKQPDQGSDSSGEVAEIEDIGDLPGPIAVPTDGLPQSKQFGRGYEPSGFQFPEGGDKWTDPIADLVADFFVELVDDIAFMINHFKGTTKVSLYDKYKNNSIGFDDPIDVLEETLENICPPLSEVIGPSNRARELIQKHKLLSSTQQFFNHSKPRVRMVYSLANAVDDDFVVLHSEERKGFIVHVKGCSDNKMLGIILAATLISKDDNKMLSGNLPSEAIRELFKGEEQALESNEQYAHPWSFSNWTCVKPDGTVPSKMAGASHWIWPEGSPSQIQKWNGQRILILSKVPFPRKFDPVRVFSSLMVEAEIKEILTEDKYKDFVASIAATPEDVRKQAHDAHLKWKC